jgi:hypothetical protein
MRYMMLIYQDESKMAAPTPGAATNMSAAYVSYTDALKAVGVWAAGDALQPTRSATAIRVADGKTNVVDGPFADTKEQLAGYYLIDTPDLDAAISWAARCPGAERGTVELRPIWEMKVVR